MPLRRPHVDPPGKVYVSSLSKLPAPVDGVITLEADTCYEFTRHLDLLGARLECAGVVCITGTSSETASVSSTGLTEPLITTAYSLPMRDITFSVAHLIDFDATDNGVQALDWRAVNVIGGVVGTVKGPSNFIVESSAWVGVRELTLDGTLGTFGFGGSVLQVGAGDTGIIVASTCSITRRFRLTYSAVAVGAGGVGIEVEDAASIAANEAFIADTVSFSGAGAYASGVSVEGNKALYVNCTGFENSRSVADVYWNGNATATTITTINTYVKAAGTSTEGSETSKFSHSDNRATYTGNRTLAFTVQAQATMTAGASDTMRLRIAKNGTPIASSTASASAGASILGRVESLVSRAVVTLAPGDYVEAWVANGSGTADITVSDLSLTATL